MAITCVLPVYADEAVDLEAGSLSYRSKGTVVQASGGVEARWKGNHLRAESVRYERDAGRLLVDGDLVLDTPTVLVGAAACELDIGEETGVLRDVVVRVKESNATFGGAVVEKRTGLRFEFDDGYFTTCEAVAGREPDWSITGTNAEIKVDDYSRIRNAAFRVRGVPVLYAPYFVFPTITRRQSGLLLPRLGASSDRGFVFSQPYFWAIDKHQDLTVTGDLESARRLGLALEYRYRPRRDIAGEIELRYYNEAIRTDSETDVVSPLFQPDEGEDIPENRVIFSGSHRQRLEDSMDVYADVLLVSDDLVLRETDSVDSGFFARSVRRTRRYTDSRAGLVASNGFASYGYRAAYYQDLVGPDRFTTQVPARLWTRADGDLGLGFSYLLDGEMTAFYRHRNNDGERLDMSATVGRPLLPTGGLLRSWGWARGRMTGYHNDNRTLRDVSPPNPPDETEVGEFLAELDGYAGRAIGEAGAELGTAFARTYDFDPEPSARFASLQHTVEPFSRLRYTSDSEDADLPLYDSVDRVDGRTTTTYGVASRFLLTRAEDASVAEVARVSLAQTYNVDDPVIEDHFSDVDATVALRPTEDVSILGLASYNVGTGDMQGAAALLSLERIRLPFLRIPRASVDAAYRFVRGGVLETADEGLETLEARTILALTDTLAIGLNGRYDFIGNEFVESGGGLRIQSSCRCWTIDLGLTNTVNPNETQFRLQLDLGGLGSIGSSALDYHSLGLLGLDRASTSARRYGW